MNKSLLIIPLFALALMSCDKDEPDVADDTTMIPSTGLVTFSVAAERVQESFVGVISRTSCGACGEYGHPTFDQALEGNDLLNGVAFHYNSNDVMYTEEAHAFAAFMGLGGTPTFTEGLANFANNSSDWKSAQDLTTSYEAQASIAIDGAWSDTAGFELDLTAVFYQDIDANVHLSVYAVENNFVTYQKDYSASPTDVPDYIHNHVLRASANGLWGESIGTNPRKDDEWSYSWTYEPGDEVNPDNVWFVAVLYRVEGGNPVQVINSQTVKR